MTLVKGEGAQADLRLSYFG